MGLESISTNNLRVTHKPFNDPTRYGYIVEQLHARGIARGREGTALGQRQDYSGLPLAYNLRAPRLHGSFRSAVPSQSERGAGLGLLLLRDIDAQSGPIVWVYGPALLCAVYQNACGVQCVIGTNLRNCAGKQAVHLAQQLHEPPFQLCAALGATAEYDGARRRLLIRALQPC